jgi:imidazoleglycerol-phosphate dehydratase
MMARQATVDRSTKETTISASIDLDGTGTSQINTGISFFDHMLEQIAKHGSFDLVIEASGDLHVDTHHTIEDVGIVLGDLIAQALGDKVGIARYASRVVPLDEAAVEVVLDVSGRPFVVYESDFPADTPGLGEPAFDPQLTEEFFRAVAGSGGLTLHIVRQRGKNVHHIIEATFKGFARVLHDATRIVNAQLPSTKGSL